MQEFISGLIENDFLSTAIMSMIPLIELKGGIVFARTCGLNFFQAFALAYLGSTIIVFPVYFLLKPLLRLLKKIKFLNKLAFSAEKYVQDKANESLEKQKRKGKKTSERKLKILTVLIFVAIPLPMTGVWMGTAIAVFLNMNFKDTVFSATLGNFIAGAIISLLAQICLRIGNINLLNVVLYVLFAVALIMLFIMLYKIWKKKKELEKDSVEKDK